MRIVSYSTVRRDPDSPGIIPREYHFINENLGVNIVAPIEIIFEKYELFT